MHGREFCQIVGVLGYSHRRCKGISSLFALRSPRFRARRRLHETPVSDGTHRACADVVHSGIVEEEPRRAIALRAFCLRNPSEMAALGLRLLLKTLRAARLTTSAIANVMTSSVRNIIVSVCSSVNWRHRFGRGGRRSRCGDSLKERSIGGLRNGGALP